MRHAFFADMGGFMLESPDFPAFPVDSHQLLHLISQKYLTYPDVDAGTIWDKNKADGFARAITLVQITWFSVQCTGRAIQHLTLSTLELLTITFIYCSLFTIFFWNHKPLDVQTPIFLRTRTRIADILIEAGDAARVPYKLTPLDFLVAPPSKANFIAAWWWGVELCFDPILFQINEKPRPVTTFANSRTRPPRGYTFTSLCMRICIALGYFAIHFAGWNFILPTPAEQKLWRIATLWFFSLYCTYLIVFCVATSISQWIAKTFFSTHASNFIELGSLLPRWAQRACLLPIYGSYSIARIYIVVEGLISIRSLPLEAYASVNWANFVPHI